MQRKDIATLFFLSAIWGFSFIFMRVISPVLGPVITADMRVLIAGLALTLYFAIIRFDVEWKKHWKQYLFIGILNSGLPFFTFSFAALHIPAGYSAILNSTTPLFAVMFASIWLGEALTLPKIGGVLLGISGVILVTKTGNPAQLDSMFSFSVAACLIAAMCYALSGVYIKKYTRDVKPLAMAGASQLLAGIAMLPAIAFSPLQGEVTLKIAGLMILFAIMCSAIAYVFYYKLIGRVGPTRALTVTFIAPVFSMMWAGLLLGEPITPKMIAGGLMIIAGASLVIKKPREVAA